MNYYLVARSEEQPDGSTRLTVKRTNTPESEPAGENFAAFLGTLTAAGFGVKRVIRTETDDSVEVIYTVDSPISIELLVAPDRLQVQLDRPWLRIFGNEQGTDVSRSPLVSADSGLYSIAKAFAEERGQVLQHQLGYGNDTSGTRLLEVFWQSSLPDGMPETPEAVDISDML